jgi:hypothetical protein
MVQWNMCGTLRLDPLPPIMCTLVLKPQSWAYFFWVLAPLPPSPNPSKLSLAKTTPSRRASSLPYHSTYVVSKASVVGCWLLLLFFFLHRRKMLRELLEFFMHTYRVQDHRVQWNLWIANLQN